MSVEREQMEFDVVVVGAGPSGLAAAIRLKQLAPDAAICVVEKAAEVGAHILSGVVLEPRALDELLPHWREMDPPEFTPAKEDRFFYLTPVASIRMPTPPQMHNEGNYIGSLGNLCRWLGTQAESLGVEIYPGFAAADLIEEDGRIVGIVTGDMGVGRDGAPTANYAPGMELRAAYTIFAEGCRGSLTKKLSARFGLAKDSQTQTYGIGIKELWEIPAENHKPGYIAHTTGWPLKSDTYGGSWLYHWGKNLVSYGMVIGLDYKNPYLSPFEEMQRLKTHVEMRTHFEGGRRIAYGARALVEGGFQSIPKLTFPGGCLVGDTAGFMNVPKIKGTHTAMKSGMLAAESVAAALTGARPAEPAGYREALDASWLSAELHKVRNIRPGFSNFGQLGGLINAALETYIFRGKAPWTLKHPHPDNESLRKAADSKPIGYPKADGKLTFDRLSSVFISNTNHEEHQPIHLKLRDPSRAIAVNWTEYRSPETRYCPAGVYEIVGADTDTPSLQINAQNCVHCKTCDIKDPTQNIDWCTPEGGGGPVYPGGM
ncbi:MAG: electron transfer flavoprotein-ubiquinone oxidoreductase [Acetobacteraceae bacterium]|nr:electron transfer flavoprotein-ubiquinone oxidoreductase [Acetobacteraceae bacterium]